VNERQALGWLAVAALVAIIGLAWPFLSALLLGVLMAFTLDPLFQWLRRRTHKPLLASLTTVLASAVVLAGATAAFVSLFVTRVVEFAGSVREQLHAGGPLRKWVDAAGGWLSHFGISPSSVTSRLEAGAGEIASHFADLARMFASGFFGVLLGLFFALLAMHLVLLNWPRMVAAMVKVSPLRPAHSKTLLREFRRVGRVTVFGTVMTGLAQGLLATIGFWISGVPSPIFFGIATALASLIPAVGTMLVWIPAGLYLFAIEQPGHAILELSWGALVIIGLSDYVIRPRLVGDEESVALLMFVALFGGAEAFGLSGLILGPVMMALAIAVLRLYEVDKPQPSEAEVPASDARTGQATLVNDRAAGTK
jgi:predicted PurR-regulated permease PerM